MRAETYTREIDAAPAAAHRETPSGAKPRGRSRRAIFLTWLRKVHLYVGLWGAALGLLFGVTGLLLNHRAILQIPVQKDVQKTAQLPLPDHAFASVQDMSAWLQKELKFSAAQVTQVRSHPPKTMIWADREVTQPERWTVSLQRPDRGVNAEYVVGNRFVRLDQLDATPIGTLTRLHKSVGVSAFWVLLTDTIAGSLILLSITGLLLWTQLHKVRTIAVMTSVSALLYALCFYWSV
jgi:hypothetical protein